MTECLTLCGSIFRHSCICVEHEQAPWNGCLGIISGTSRCQPGTLIHVPFHRQERRQLAGWLVTIGSSALWDLRRELSSIWMPYDRECTSRGYSQVRLDGLSRSHNVCSLEGHSILFPGVGRPGYVAAGACPNTRSCSHPHFSSTTHPGRYPAHRHHVDEAE